MWRRDLTAVVVDTCTTVDSDDHGRPRGADSVVPVGQVVRSWAVEALVAAYRGDTEAFPVAGSGQVRRDTPTAAR
jgi:hypothetical protein